jgi:hypothetical protein
LLCAEGIALMALVKRHPVITFFLLAYALSWLGWPMWALGLYPNPVFGFGPFLAALLVLAITRGKSGVGGLLRRMVRWRVGLGWYAVALLLPVGLALGATVLNVMLGARAPSSVELGSWPSLLVIFAPASLAHSVHNVAWGTLAALTATSSPVLVNEYLAGDNRILILMATAIVAVWLGSKVSREVGSGPEEPQPVEPQSRGASDEAPAI